MLDDSVGRLEAEVVWALMLVAVEEESVPRLAEAAGELLARRAPDRRHSALPALRVRGCDRL